MLMIWKLLKIVKTKDILYMCILATQFITEFSK